MNKKVAARRMDNDLYALCVTFFDILTSEGKLPEERTRREFLQALKPTPVKRGGRAAASALRARVATLCSVGLQHRRADRFATIHELARAWNGYCRGSLWASVGLAAAVSGIVVALCVIADFAGFSQAPVLTRGLLSVPMLATAATALGKTMPAYLGRKWPAWRLRWGTFASEFRGTALAVCTTCALLPVAAFFATNASSRAGSYRVYGGTGATIVCDSHELREIAQETVVITFPDSCFQRQLRLSPDRFDTVDVQAMSVVAYLRSPRLVHQHPPPVVPTVRLVDTFRDASIPPVVPDGGLDASAVLVDAGGERRPIFYQDCEVDSATARGLAPSPDRVNACKRVVGRQHWIMDDVHPYGRFTRWTIPAGEHALVSIDCECTTLDRRRARNVDPGRVRRQAEVSYAEYASDIRLAETLIVECDDGTRRRTLEQTVRQSQWVVEQVHGDLEDQPRLVAADLWSIASTLRYHASHLHSDVGIVERNCHIVHGRAVPYERDAGASADGASDIAGISDAGDTDGSAVPVTPLR